MDDLASMLSGLLNSPEGMEQLKNMAGTLLGEQKAEPARPTTGDFSGISPKEKPATISGVMPAFFTAKAEAKSAR